MIAWTMAQVALLGALLALAAFGAESALRAAGRPTRWAWVGALLMTLMLAALAPLRAVTETVSSVMWKSTSIATDTPTVATTVTVLGTLRAAWHELTAIGSDVVQQAWSAWHATVPVGTERVLLAAWLIASIVLLVAFITIHVRFQRRRAHWPLGTVHGTTVRIAGDIGPAVIGVTRAEIVVPRWLLSRDDREQQLVLAHELEHLRTHDPLLLAVAQAAIVLLPWHPAVWWMAARLRLAVELDCDRRVLQRGASARDYGTLLIDLTDHRTGFGAALPAFSCTPSHLERRLIAMTPKPLRYPLLRALSTGALASLALLAACEANLPTADEVDGMTAATATAAVSKVALMDTSRMTYFVNDVVATKAQADAVAPDSIANVNVIKVSDGTGEIRITTRKPGDAPLGTKRTTLVVDTAIVTETALDGAVRMRIVAPGGTNTTEPSGKMRTVFDGLMVIDGVIRESNAMNTLSPDRILSVNVIKGPAATAKYSDPRAAKGVIEITTKQVKP
ncbi:MAG: M56 family metallopeptidase [Gemmatimonadota bacterium]